MTAFFASTYQKINSFCPKWMTVQFWLWLCCTFVWTGAVGVSSLYVVPYIVKIPQDFRYSADVISLDNFYDVAKGTYSGEQLSSTVFGYSTAPLQTALAVDTFF
jgi:hypothetical protein